MQKYDLLMRAIFQLPVKIEQLIKSLKANFEMATLKGIFAVSNKYRTKILCYNR